jgi:phenylalanine-4-hydroxylase
VTAQACSTTYPITTYQPQYFVAESLVRVFAMGFASCVVPHRVCPQTDMKLKMREFIETRPRAFHVKYDPYSQTVSVDRAITRGAYRVTLQS